MNRKNKQEVHDGKEVRDRKYKLPSGAAVKKSESTGQYF
jgi:hypothetical protein